jgi:hypothetical protein
MDVHIGSKDGPAPSVAAVADQFDREIGSKQTQWLEMLAADPGRFAEVEQDIHLTFSKIADHTAAAILAKASKRSQMPSHQKKSWRQRLNPFARRRSAP